MTREKAVKIIKEFINGTCLHAVDQEALETLIPELKESEDERVIKIIINCLQHDESLSHQDVDDCITYLEKQKDQNEKTLKPELKTPEWVFRGWDDEYMINTVIGRYSLHAEVAKKCGDTHDYNLSKSMENWLRNVVKPLILEKQKEPENVSASTMVPSCWTEEPSLQNEQSITANDLDEEINRFFDECIEPHDAKIYGVDERVITVGCYELTARHFAKWAEEHKGQKSIKTGGTTICGQDYKCKKDYKEGNCWYIKDAIYHCSRDGYLTDQNGVSWSCTPEWFNEYIQSNTEWAEEEKTRFVSGQFLQCKLSFDEFKEGEHYWLEYVGDDMYIGRSDNILNQKFHITPRQLYTLFSQQLEEVQGPPQEEKQRSLNYEPSFDENPSDEQIIDALIHHLNEQDGFLTAINCVSTKAILSWLRRQKEQKPSEDLEEAAEELFETIEVKEHENIFDDTFKKIFFAGAKWEKEHRSVSYSPLCNTIKDKIREYIANNFVTDTIVNTDVKSIVKAMEEGVRLGKEEQKPIDYDAELKKCKDNPLYFYDKYVSIKLKSKKWSEEDEKRVKQLIYDTEAIRAGYEKRKESLGDDFNDELIKDCDEQIKWLKSLRPSWKPSKEQMEALNYAIAEWDGGKKLEGLYALRNDLKKLM